MRILTLILLAAASHGASAACSHSKTIRHSFPAGTFESTVVNALAGRLDVIGTTGDTIEFEGRACTDREEYLDRMELDIEDSGDVLELTVMIPYDDRDFDARYAHMDVEVRLPKSMAVALRDSSGDILVRGATVTSIDDSSGNIRVTGSTGALAIDDSSGNIDLRDIDGTITIRDSSGSISIRGALADVEIPRDSSGDIDIEQVTGNVHIARDSSGDIDIDEVKGRVAIDTDSSGDIEISNVGGGVEIGSDGSGRVRIDDIGGDFALLAKGSGDIRVRGVEGRVTTPR